MQNHECSSYKTFGMLSTQLRKRVVSELRRNFGCHLRCSQDLPKFAEMLKHQSLRLSNWPTVWAACTTEQLSWLRLGWGYSNFRPKKVPTKAQSWPNFITWLPSLFIFPFWFVLQSYPRTILAPSSLRARSSLRRSSLGSAKKFVADLAIYRDLSQAPIYRSESEQVPGTVQGRRSVVVYTKCHQERKPETE